MYVWICVNMFGRAATDWQLHFSTLQHASPYCHTLQRTATHCNTLQHTATHRNTLQHRGVRRGCNCTLDRACIHGCSPSCGSQVLHCVAVRCSALQCVVQCAYIGAAPPVALRCCTVLHCVALWCTVVHSVAFRWINGCVFLVSVYMCISTSAFVCVCVCLYVSVSMPLSLFLFFVLSLSLPLKWVEFFSSLENHWDH